MEGNGSEDGFIIVKNSLIQKLLDMKCQGCGSRNFLSQIESAFALVSIFFVKCQDCGRKELMNTCPRTLKDFRQVDKLIIDYAFNSKGGQELVRDLLKMKTKKEHVKDVEMDEEIELTQEIDIKEEIQEIDTLKPADELIVPETVESFVGLVKIEDQLNRDDHGIKTSRANRPEVIANRARVIELWESGNNVAEIVRMTGFGKSTVYKWISRWQREGTVQTKPRSGRPPISTHNKDARLVAAVSNQHLTSAVQLTHDLQLPYHVRPTKRHLHENNSNIYFPVKKEKLNPGQERGPAGICA